MNKKYLIFTIICFLLLSVVFYFFKISRDEVIIPLQQDVKLDLGNCDNFNDNKSEQLNCWDDLVRSSVENYGIAYSLNVLAKLYENPIFATNCHSFTHTIGRAAYLQFTKNNKIEVSPKMNYCSFGFYHGFMEELFAKGGDIKTAQDLCYYMDSQTDNVLKYTSGACFHGMGHGVVDGSNKKDWGNAKAIAEPGLELCNKVISNDEEGYRCYSGVFNSIAIAYSGKQYGLILDSKDPFRVCREEEDKYGRACYAEMAAAVMNLVSNDLLKTAQTTENIINDSYAKEVIKNAAGVKVSKIIENTDFDFSIIIKECQSMPERLQISCIRGFGASLIEFGQPGNSYLKAFEFCSEKTLTDEQKLGCFSDSIGLLRVTVNAEQFNMMCNKVEKKYRYLCQI